MILTVDMKSEQRRTESSQISDEETRLEGSFGMTLSDGFDGRGDEIERSPEICGYDRQLPQQKGIFSHFMLTEDHD
jgi:hypothetical protein